MEDESMRHMPPAVLAELDADFGAALDQIDAGLAALAALGDRGDVMALGPDRLVGFARRVEAHRARLMVIDGFIVEAAEAEDLVTRTRGRSLAGALSDVLRIDYSQAKARVDRAEMITARSELSTGVVEPRLPVLATAVRAGEVTVDQAKVITTSMRGFLASPDLGSDETTAAENALVAYATAFGPLDLKIIARKIDEHLRPDGILADPRVAAARRGIEISPERRDGTHEISGLITRVLAAKLHAVLSPLAAPRPSDPSGSDDRSAPQRMHDALEDVADRLLRSGTLPDSGGTPATVHVAIDVDRLRAQLDRHDPERPSAMPLGTTTTAGSVGERTRLTLTEVLALGVEAELVPVYLTSNRGIIGYGRCKRIATRGQTNALIARDGGCSFPGCDVPPQWCQRHHVLEWIFGGTTDLDNLCLLCAYHHREFLARGWRVVMHGGIPVWIPPRYLDPQQRPQINTRILLPSPRHVDDIMRALAAREPTDTGPPDIPPDIGLFPDPVDIDADEPDDVALMDELLTALGQQIPVQRRDDFHRELADLLDAYRAAPESTGLFAGTA